MKSGYLDQTESGVHVALLDSPQAYPRPLLSGTHILIVLFLLVTHVVPRDARAGDVLLGWNPNTEPVLAGYRLYYGNASHRYQTSIDVGKVITYKVCGLPAGTYYFAVTAYSATEETTYSNEVSAVVSPSDTTPPSISGVAVTGISWSSAVLSWSTDEPADTQLEYGLTAGYGSLTATDVALVTRHTVALNGLAAATTYHYRVRSRDAAGNSSISGDFTFMTSALPDTTPPVISAIRSSSISNNSATITWTTDEPSDTQVEYGASAGYGSSTTLSPSLLTSHSQTLTGLSAGTMYHFRVKSRDAAGNQAISGDNIFTTTSLPDITSGLVAAYSFDEGAGSRAADTSAKGNSATLYNAAWTTKAKFGKALAFNGKNSYVSAGTTGLPAVSGPKTISCWLSVSGGGGPNQSVIVLANEAQQASVEHGFKSSLVGVLQYGGTWLVSANSPAPKAWHHFTYSFDGTQNRFYIDGILVSTSTIEPKVASVTGFQIGRWIAGSDYFKGSVDELRIYNRALNEEEIRTVMNTPIAGSLLAPSGAVAMAKLEVAEDDQDAQPVVSSAQSADFNAEVQSDRTAAIDIRLSRRLYFPGERVTASACWMSNPSGRDRDIELKAWLTGPGLSPVAISDQRTSEVFTIPAGFDQDLGPKPLFEVSGDMAAGVYRLNTLMMDPVTGDALSGGADTFVIAGEADTSRRGADSMDVSRGADLLIESHLAGYVPDGDQQVAGYRISNRGDTPASVEVKVWVEATGRSTTPVFALGGDGSLILPAGSDLNLDPLALSRRLDDLPSGSYQLRSRILDPITGQLLSETVDELVLR